MPWPRKAFVAAVVLLPLLASASLRVRAQTFEGLDEAATPLTIDDVTRTSLSKQFRPTSAMPSTNRNIARWYRFLAPAPNGTTYLLTVAAHVSDAELYFPRANGSYAIERFGMRLPYAARPYPLVIPAVALPGNMRGGERLYLRAYGPTNDPSIRPQQQVDGIWLAIERWTLFFAGFLLAIGMSSLFLALYLRERAFVLQALLMGVSLLYTLVDSQLAWKYLWPTVSISYVLADSIAFLAYLFVLLLFSRSFLSLDRHHRPIDTLLWSAFALNVAFTFVVEPAAPDSSLINAVTPIVNFLPFPILLVAAFVRWAEGFRQARFFAFGLGGMIAIFVAAGLLRSYSFARWGFDAGVAFYSLFFQFALADRVISANRARDEAQRSALATQSELVETQRESIETLARHNEAFSRFVPREFLTLLGRGDIVDVRLGDHVEREMNVLFTDIRSFTAISENLTPRASFEFINDLLGQAGPVIREHGGFVDKYIGDAIMALFPGAVDDALDAAIALQQQVRRFNEQRARGLQKPICVGVGLHRGKLMLGTVGEERRLETTVIAGTVNVASRLEHLTKIFGAQIVISGAAAASIADRERYRLRYIGMISVPGLSSELGAFEVCDADEPEVLLAKVADAQAFEDGVEAFSSGEFSRSLALFDGISLRNGRDAAAAYYRERSATAVRDRGGRRAERGTPGEMA
ncbi:MAG: 7TM diverse intracellular signaling domain-containing protein [Candidatus Cybelea sp.]